MKKAKRTLMKIIVFVLEFLIFYWLLKTGQYKLIGLILIGSLIFALVRGVIQGVFQGLTRRARRSHR